MIENIQKRAPGIFWRTVERLAGRRVELPAGLSMSTVLRYYLGKALLPLLRGVFRQPFMRSSKWPFFVGRGVVIRFPELLSCGKSVNLGDRVRIDALSKRGVSLGDRVSIREGGIIQLTSHLNNLGDCVEIGDDVYIGPSAFIGAAAKVVIGSKTLIGPGLTIIAEQHDFEGDTPVFEQGVTRGGVDIGPECWIGANVTVLDGVKIGRNSVVGAGSVVTRSLPANAIAYGVPAKVKRIRSSESAAQTRVA